MAKRSRILIDPKVQWALALRVLGHWGLLIICLLLVNALISLMMMAGDKPLPNAVGDAFRSQTPLLMVLVVLIPVFVRDTIKLSNRFAGPMYRIRMGLAAINDAEKSTDEIQPIQLRSGDFWGVAAADFNQVLKSMQEMSAENERLKKELQQAESESALV